MMRSDFGDDSQIRHRAKTQAIVVKHFWSRWRHEYLTALRETHRKTGNNVQQVKVGDVVLVHDNTTRVNWKLAVIESLNKGGDGMIRSANIYIATGRTNRPIARLYHLEMTAPEMTIKPSNTEVSEDQYINQPTIPTWRPVCEAARVGQEWMKEWISSLKASRRMSQTVTNFNCIYCVDLYIVGYVYCSCVLNSSINSANTCLV